MNLSRQTAVCVLLRTPARYVSTRAEADEDGTVSWDNPAMLVERVTRFVQGEPDDFEALALAAFAFQYERIPPYRALCERRGATPANVSDWRQVPPVPTPAFKTLRLASAPAVETFRSTGTTSAARSVHLHGYPELYRATIDASFPAACLGPLRSPPTLSLVPGRDLAPDSSLAFMIDHVVRRFGGEPSVSAFGVRGVAAPAARGWLAARQRDGRPGLVLATSLALLELLAALERLGLRFRLPPGTVVFDTGGTKGRTRAISRAELLERLECRLAVSPSQVVREYGMTELTSQCYTGALRGGDPDLFVPPRWMRVRVLDPETLEEAEPGRSGLLAVFDLANLSSAVHVLTEDLGAAASGGFRLTGRAAGAELRGCSLVVEELGEGG